MLVKDTELSLPEVESDEVDLGAVEVEAEGEENGGDRRSSFPSEVKVKPRFAE